jgi:hypothetical protein
MRNLTKLDTFFVILITLLFLVFSALVIFKKDWLDSIFFGDSSQELVSLSPDLEDRILSEIGNPVDLEIRGDSGNASIFLNLKEDLSITGVELYLLKRGNLEVGEMVCEPPFECLFVDTEGIQFSVKAIISPESVQSMDSGEVLLGTFTYSGAGSVKLESDSESFVVEIENPTFNVLSIYEKEFIF